MSSLSVDAITAKTANTNLTLTGSGTGKVVLGDGGLVLPDADGTSGQFLQTNGSGTLSFASVADAGVVQVKGAFTDAYTTHANTNVDNPADILSVSITPTSASNKILVMGLFTGNSTNTSVQYLGVKLARGATEIGSGDATTRNSTEGELHSSDSLAGDYSKPTSVHALYLDSPATTSATTYKLQAFANRFGSSLDNSTLVQNSGGYNYNNKEQGVGTCSLIVMEVAP
jgi:hypothetical protein